MAHKVVLPLVVSSLQDIVTFLNFNFLSENGVFNDLMWGPLNTKINSICAINKSKFHSLAPLFFFSL